MSENPNPTRCGNCGTMNPPGEEFCVKCQAPLTITGDADVLDQTPEALDEPASYAPERAEDTPDVVVMGGLEPMPTEDVGSEADRRPRD